MPSSMYTHATLTCAAVAFLLAGSSLAVEPSPFSPETTLNAFTTGNQTTPAVASDGAGKMVVVWQSLDQDGDSYGIVGRVFGLAGDETAEFVVNETTVDQQKRPAVGMEANGDFVVVWGSRQLIGGYELVGRFFDSAGSPVLGEFEVGDEVNGEAQVATKPDGAFMVVWATGSPTAIQMRRFASNGLPITIEETIIASGSTLTAHHSPKLDLADDGSFVVSWVTNELIPARGDFLDQESIELKRFASDGSPNGDASTIYQVLDAYSFGSSDVMHTEDGFLVLFWEGPSLADIDVFAQRVSSTGDTVGVPLHLDDNSVAADAGARILGGDDSFVVVWGSDRDGSSGGLTGRQIHSDGSFASDLFQVNTFTTDRQSGAALATVDAATGVFAVVWGSGAYAGTASPDASGRSVQGRTFSPLLFGDGFESGDVSSW